MTVFWDKQREGHSPVYHDKFAAQSVVPVIAWVLLKVFWLCSSFLSHCLCSPPGRRVYIPLKITFCTSQAGRGCVGGERAVEYAVRGN